MRRNYGWKKDSADDRDQLLPLAPRELVTNLPPQVDLREQMPGVYDQGELGSCTANAIAAAYEFDTKKQGLTDFMPSRLFIYYNERALEGTIGEDAGAMIRDGMKVVAKQGVCPESEWPYDVARFAVKPTYRCYGDALQHRSLKYLRVTRTVELMRACLAAGYPFVFGFTVYESFESDEVATSGVLQLPKRGEQNLGGHAVLAVGYDIASDVFIVRNSWGSSWGQSGYFTIPTSYINSRRLASDFWTLRSVS